jgi:hypothetical protein
MIEGEGAASRGPRLSFQVLISAIRKQSRTSSAPSRSTTRYGPNGLPFQPCSSPQITPIVGRPSSAAAHVLDGGETVHFQIEINLLQVSKTRNFGFFLVIQAIRRPRGGLDILMGIGR